MIDAFIRENTKTRIKHNTLTQILNFKQKEKETVRDAIGRLKALILRCPPREMPEEDCLISCFLESLRDRSLHVVQLSSQNHVKLNKCFDEALLYEDNYTWGGAIVQEDSADGSSHTSRYVNSEAIVDIVLQIMRQEGKGNYVPRGAGYPQAYICGTNGSMPKGS